MYVFSPSEGMWRRLSVPVFGRKWANIRTAMLRRIVNFELNTYQRGNARLHEELNGSAADFSQRSERGGMRKLAVEQDILDLLRSADGVTTHDVAERLAISISTASKYLEALKREGRVAYTPVGPAKVWRLPETMPALQDFDHLKRNLTLSGNGAVLLFEERAAIAPVEGLRALHRELERADPAVARRALYAMGHAMGRHVARVAAGRTKAVGAELLRASLGYLSLKGWGKHSITAFDPARPRLAVRSFATLLAKGAGQKAPADHVVAGALAGVFSAVTGVNGVGKETRCRAAGGPYCEFVVEPG